MYEYRYKTKGVCSLTDYFGYRGRYCVKSAMFIGGCNGNLKGICALISGMKIDDIIEKCQGITCGSRSTSCPDQLTKALIAVKEEIAAKV
ncbi:MAG: TIGR03905 family TSCPD domain-containing protein [Eubacteriales bacterium]